MANIAISKKLRDDLQELLNMGVPFEIVTDMHGWFRLEGKMQTNGKHVFNVTIKIPRDYPLSSPRAIVPDSIKGRLRSAPHYYHSEKKLCLYKDIEWFSSPQNLVWFFGRIGKWFNKWNIWVITGGPGTKDPKTGEVKNKGVWPGKDAHFPEKYKRN